MAPERRAPGDVLRRNIDKSGPDFLTRMGGPQLPGIDAFFVSQFEEIVERFLEHWGREDHPTMEGDLQVALVMLAHMLLGYYGENEPPEVDDPNFRTLMLLVSAGYSWRVADGTTLDPRVYPIEDLTAIVRDAGSADPRRSVVLAQATHECLNRNVSFTSASPGGIARGRVFLDSGYEYVASEILCIETATDEDEANLRAAFYLGVLLRDVEQYLEPNVG